MTGGCVSEIRERAEYLDILANQLADVYGASAVSPVVVASFASRSKRLTADLLAEVAALRGRLAAVEAEVARYDDGCQGADECCAETLSADIRAALDVIR